MDGEGRVTGKGRSAMSLREHVSRLLHPGSARDAAEASIDPGHVWPELCAEELRAWELLRPQLTDQQVASLVWNSYFDEVGPSSWVPYRVQVYVDTWVDPQFYVEREGSFAYLCLHVGPRSRSPGFDAVLAFLMLVRHDERALLNLSPRRLGHFQRLVERRDRLPALQAQLAHPSMPQPRELHVNQDADVRMFSLLISTLRRDDSTMPDD
jgi:hypothetical protein